MVMIVNYKVFFIMEMLLISSLLKINHPHCTGYQLQKLEKQDQQSENIGIKKERRRLKELKNITQHYGFLCLINQENLER